MARLPGSAALALLSVVVSACSGAGGRYPSLELRPAERVSGTLTAAPAVEQPDPIPDGQSGRLGALEAAARAAHARFVERAASARQLVKAARGADPGETRWAAAQIALADLDGIRSEAAIALGDIDLMFVEATLTNTDRVAIEHGREAIVALIAQQDSILAELRGDAR